MTTLLAACAPAPPPAPDYPVQQLPLGIEYAGRSGSSSSSSSISYNSGKGLTVPSRPRATDSTRLSVRPDSLRAGFAVRELGATPEAALQAARGKIDSVSAELLRATRPTASIKVKSFTLARNTRDGKVVDVSASVDGVLEIPLLQSEDFWARSKLFASLIEVAQRIVAAYETEDGLRAVSFDTPQAQVLDPEAYRPELIKRWVERARGFAVAAEADGAKLFIRDCAPPGPIVQTVQSFDEVSLELGIGCRIDLQGGIK